MSSEYRGRSFGDHLAFVGFMNGMTIPLQNKCPVHIPSFLLA